MSTGFEIAAVTATLTNILLSGIQNTLDLQDTNVTTQHPGIARGTFTSNQVNVFLYRITVGGAFGKFPAGTPPLALQLCYLITAYGRDNDPAFEQRLLDRVMSILHDQPVIAASQNQPAEARIAWQPLSVDELSSLWVSFETPFRVSASYQVSPLLIPGEPPR